MMELQQDQRQSQVSRLYRQDKITLSRDIAELYPESAREHSRLWRWPAQRHLSRSVLTETPPDRLWNGIDD